MFAQFITAPVTDSEAVEAHGKRWLTGLAPGAQGWQASIGGVTPDGRLASVVLFDTQDSADRNARRPEQDRWWRQLLGLLTAAPEVVDSTDVRLFGTGDVREFGFVQIIRGQATDLERTRDLAGPVIETALRHRPEILAVMLAMTGDAFVQTVGFRAEADARAGERRGRPDAVAAAEEELLKLVTDLEYLDLPAPLAFCPEDLPG